MAKIAVAPLVGARIEIKITAYNKSGGRSLPSWERGLKSIENRKNELLSMSLPSWERGLKLLATSIVPLLVRRSPRGSED